MPNPLIRSVAVAVLGVWPSASLSQSTSWVYESVGIPPDVFVPLTAADSIAGRDVQLERALAIARAP